MGQRPGNRLKCETQIISDIPAAHRKRHQAYASQATIHFKEKSGNALPCVLSTKKQHMILGMPKIGRRHRPKSPGNLNIDTCRLFQTAASYQAHIRIDDSFGRQAMDRAGLQSENVPRQIKRSNLSPAI